MTDRRARSTTQAYSAMPLLAMVTLAEGLPEELPSFSTALTTSEPAMTCEVHDAPAATTKTWAGRREARTHLAEHDVLAVEPGGGNGGDKKLAAVGVGA
jgi:hypothetical protein